MFISTGLGVGGAEITLSRLLGALDKRVAATVVSLAGDGAVGGRIRDLGVPVTPLGLRDRGRLAAWRALAALAREFRPDVVQGWMYHGNLAASLVRRRWAPAAGLAWGIRQSIAGARQEKTMTRAVIRLGAWLSPGADAIVYNAARSADEHERDGYDGRRRVVIPNGVDCETFRPEPDRRREVRRSLGIDEGALVVGQAARYHPMKGHAVMLAALAELRRQGIDAQLLLAGRDVDHRNPNLGALCERLGLRRNVHLIGERDDLHRIWQAVDIGVSPSEWGEGFPTAVAEAMASAVPCVVTDVGDSATLVADSGLVVTPGDSKALAGALAQLVSGGPDVRRALGVRARERVQALYGVGVMAKRFEDLYVKLAESRSTRGR